MTVIKFLLVVLYVIACGVLIFVVLLQQGRGAGLGASLGGGASQTLFGSRASNFMTRVTAVMAGLYMVLAIVLALYPPFSTDTSSDVQDILAPEEVQQPAPAPEGAAVPMTPPPAEPALSPEAAPEMPAEGVPAAQSPAAPTPEAPAIPETSAEAPPAESPAAQAEAPAATPEQTPAEAAAAAAPETPAEDATSP